MSHPNSRRKGGRRKSPSATGSSSKNWASVSSFELCAYYQTFRIVGLAPNLIESQSILASHGDGIANYANELNIQYTYCIPVDAVIAGVSGRVLLYFDAHNHIHLCNELSEQINRLKAELATLKRYPKSKLSRYESYFTITKHENDSGFDYSVDVDKVNNARKRKGYFLIFTTDMEATPEDTLYHYRAKDAIEKLFCRAACKNEPVKKKSARKIDPLWSVSFSRM